MTKQERHSPNTFENPPSRSGCPQGDASAGQSSLMRWEDCFSRATVEQQQCLLTLAQAGGVLQEKDVSQVLASQGDLATRLEQIRSGEMEPLRSPPDPPSYQVDETLDDAQRDALLRAASTSDIHLIQGLPGTGKTRVVSRLLVEAAARSERVLLVSHSAAALDRVLEQLPCGRGAYPQRLLGPEETFSGLSPRIRRLVLEERIRLFEEQTLPGARKKLEQLQQRYEGLKRDESLLTQLEKLADESARLSSLEQSLQKKLAAVGDEVKQLVESEIQASKTPALRKEHPEIVAGLEKISDRQAELTREQKSGQEKHDALTREEQRLRPYTEAKRGGRWWTLSWWFALFSVGLEKQRTGLEAELARSNEDLARMEQEAVQLGEQWHSWKQQLLEAETRRRQGHLEQELSALHQQQDRLHEQWVETRQALSGEAAPVESTPEALLEGLRTHQEAFARTQKELQSAEEWLHALEEIRPTVAARFRERTNIVAVPLQLLQEHDSILENRFDLLVVEESEAITEEEFLGIARHARRWVLVGEPTRNSVGSTPFFQHLWNCLAPDPTKLPYRWHQRPDALICSLQELTPEQRRWVQVESVADRPEVVLRFYAAPGNPPQLVEVHFPARTSIQDAKAYLFGELEELTIHPAGPQFVWEETAQAIHLRFCGPNVTRAERVCLEDGVHEYVYSGSTESGPSGEVTWQTSALSFDRESGWNRRRAEEWVSRRLNIPILGRSSMLSRPHRMQPALARWLSDSLFEGSYRDVTYQTNGISPVAFIPVPSMEEESGSRSTSMKGKRSAPGNGRGGAGLEVDLSRPTHESDAIPGDLRRLLPDRGLVNYREAVEVVRFLESLTNDSNFKQTAQAWRQRHADQGYKADTQSPACPNVAVMALYPAQVELLRHLVKRSTLNDAVSVEVGLPQDFRQRECQIALVSLTRSHSHRAVTYGSTPGLLARALTIATDRITLFGDAGTLIRRSHWDGPVDHLQGADAQQERNLVLRLVGCLPHDRPPRLPKEADSASRAPRPKTGIDSV